jgi:hypothetical protein
VEAGGNLTLADGAVITDNRNADGNMRGGGVYVAGTLAMTGGVIRNNFAGYGGGVYVAGGGNFTMSGGIISKNTATTSGGGVCIDIDGSFAKTGGTIYGAVAGHEIENCTEAGLNGHNDPFNGGEAVSVLSGFEITNKRDSTAEPGDNLYYKVNGIADSGWE